MELYTFGNLADHRRAYRGSRHTVFAEVKHQQCCVFFELSLPESFDMALASLAIAAFDRI